jgi:hypothetical protein
MKKLIVLLVVLVLILPFASCISIYPASPSAPQSSPSAPQSTPSEPRPSLEPQPSEIPAVTPETGSQAYTGPVIIAANTDVIGGFADGRWLTHSEAAAYCQGQTTFYKYGIAGFSGTAESSGLTTQENGGYIYSRTADMGKDEYDESGSYTLNVDTEPDYGDYSADVFGAGFLYTLPPEYLPMMDVCDNTEDIENVIQRMIDENLGTGAAEANIRSAVIGDIDGDGEYEKAINADNCAGLIYEELDDLYSISIILESDGSVISVYESYVSENTSEFSSTELVYIQNILDIDGDGMCELVLDGTAWEAWWSEVYKYDGSRLSKVLEYGTGA